MMIKKILQSPDKEIEGVKLKVAEVKQIKGHEKISHKVELVEVVSGSQVESI